MPRLTFYRYSITLQLAITDEQKARLDAVAAMPDERIDYTDAPYLPDAAWVKVAELPLTRNQRKRRI